MNICFEFNENKVNIDIDEDKAFEILFNILMSPKDSIIEENKYTIPSRDIILEYIEHKPNYTHCLNEIIEYVKHIGYKSPTGEFSNMGWENAIRSKISRIRKYIGKRENGKWIFTTDIDKYRTFKFVRN